MKSWSTILYLAVATSACATPAVHGPITSLESFYGTAQRIDIVRHADGGEIDLVAPKGRELSEAIGDYDILQGVKLDSTATHQLQAIMLDAVQYRWPDKVLPDGRVVSQVGSSWHGYQVFIVLQQGRQSVTFGVSFLWFIGIIENGRPWNWAFLTSAHRDLFDFVFARFPNDPRLQKFEQQLAWKSHVRSLMEPTAP